MMEYEYWLAGLYAISHEKRRRACEIAGGAEKLYRMSEAQLESMHLFMVKELEAVKRSKMSWDPAGEWQDFLKKGIRFLTCFDDGYPERLKHIYNSPYAIFVRGNLPSDRQKSVAVIGARSCSEYGRGIAMKLGKTLAQNGIPVISGMAVGVDSASHAGALSAGGLTFAVLGSGCDVCYPKSSRNIYENIISGEGGVISELLPGTQPLPAFFPMRNRIISALADIVVVVEARERSGSLITADFALEQGKDVYAVPGRCLDKLSAGCNRLIEQGAGIIVDIDSFLKNSGIVELPTKSKAKDQRVFVSKESEIVYGILEMTPKYIDDITGKSGLGLLVVLDALDSLKKSDMAQETFPNYFSRKI